MSDLKDLKPDDLTARWEKSYIRKNILSIAILLMLFVILAFVCVASFSESFLIKYIDIKCI